MHPVVQPQSGPCTNGAFQYRRFCRDTGIEHCPVGGKKRRLKTWMARFKGVATKYLPNYLAWHLYVDQALKMSPTAAAKQMLVETCSVLSTYKVA